jgi:hypothetical protein
VALTAVDANVLVNAALEFILGNGGRLPSCREWGTKRDAERAVAHRRCLEYLQQNTIVVVDCIRFESFGHSATRPNYQPLQGDDYPLEREIRASFPGLREGKIWEVIQQVRKQIRRSFLDHLDQQLVDKTLDQDTFDSKHPTMVAIDEARETSAYRDAVRAHTHRAGAVRTAREEPDKNDIALIRAAFLTDDVVEIATSDGGIHRIVPVIQEHVPGRRVVVVNPGRPPTA